ncbi:MAG TPA: transglutaminase, partial [Syntrophobacteraceae bacterium]|nr:transglutaminase [Syntrophobacteraceae bacterium]
VAYLGSYDDVPVAAILAAWEQAYGKDRLQGWIGAMEHGEDVRTRDFTGEEVIKD